jgi:hypothetical protein
MSKTEPWIEGMFYGFFQESSRLGNTLTCAIVSPLEGDLNTPVKLWNWEGNIMLQNNIKEDAIL